MHVTFYLIHIIKERETERWVFSGIGAYGEGHAPDEKELKKVDVVIVLGDARAVERTSNRDFVEVLKNKRRILVLYKSDLAD